MEQNRSYLLGTRRTSTAIEERKKEIQRKKLLSEMQKFCAIQEQNLQREILRIDDGMQNLAENIRVNNYRHEFLQNSIKEIELSFENIKSTLVANISEEEGYSAIDYIDFENHFRGSIELIKERQMKYIPYFIGCKNVVDIGCGRGEFLELLQEENIYATGVDIYLPCVELCSKKGLKVLNMDCVEFLNQQEVVDGIFISQVVEHISINKLCELISVCHRKLKKDSYLIIETPNPCSVSTFTNAFYMDPSHNKPVHPMTLQYILQKTGFTEAKIMFTDDSKYPLVIPRLILENESNAEEFNDAMETISNLLFGSQDYAIIAKR